MDDDKYLLDKETLDWLAEDTEEYLDRFIKTIEKTSKNY